MLSEQWCWNSLSLSREKRMFVGESAPLCPPMRTYKLDQRTHKHWVKSKLSNKFQGPKVRNTERTPPRTGSPSQPPHLTMILLLVNVYFSHSLSHTMYCLMISGIDYLLRITNTCRAILFLESRDHVSLLLLYPPKDEHHSGSRWMINKTWKIFNDNSHSTKTLILYDKTNH